MLGTIILFVMSAFAAFVGFLTISGAETVHQETEGLLMWVCACILFSGAAIYSVLDEIRKGKGD